MTNIFIVCRGVFAPSKTSMMERFCENSSWLFAAHYFHKNAPSQILDWVLKAHLVSIVLIYTLQNYKAKIITFLQYEYLLMVIQESDVLILPVPCIFENCIEINIKLNFNFHTSLWCLKRFYEGL